MKTAEFTRWVESARELGATFLEVRRQRQTGAVQASVFMREELAGIEPDRIIERMREDIVSKHRRLTKATFEVVASRKEKEGGVEVMRDVVVILRDEVDEGTPGDSMTIEGASVEMQRIALAAAREAHRDLRDMAMGTMQTLQGVCEHLSGKLVESQEKVASVLQVAFEFSTLQHEREDAVRASSERRELGKVALEELAPIAGAALAEVTKRATPAWAGFAQRLQTSGKLPKILDLLDPEEVAALGTALGLTFPKKEAKQEDTKDAQATG